MIRAMPHTTVEQVLKLRRAALKLEEENDKLVEALKTISNRANKGISECNDDGFDLACDILDIAEETLKQTKENS